MRTRSYTSAPAANAISYRYPHAGNCANPDPTGVGVQQIYSYVPVSTTRVMHDEVVPLFRARSKRGEIINNPYDRTETIVTETPATITGAQGNMNLTNCSGVWINVANYNHWTGVLPASFYTGSGYLAAPALDVARVIDLAVTASWAKADLSETQGLVTLAEGRKTIDSVASILKRIYRIGKSIRRLDARGLYKQLTAKELSNRYMEQRYAIRPLLYDMKTSLAAFRAPRKRPERQTFRAGSSDSGTASQAGVLTYDVPGWMKVFCDKTTQRSVTARAGVLAAITSISEASIWGLDKPMEALWELIPFSFVVDWFCNVGKVIASWSPSPGISPLASWVVVDDTTFSTITMVSSVSQFSGNVNTVKLTGGSVQRLIKTRYRVVNPTRAIVPRINVRLDGFKLLDLGIMAKRFF